MSRQGGELKLIGNSWFVRYYLDGKRKMTKLASKSDYDENTITSKFQEFMSHVNKPSDERPVEFNLTARTTVAGFVTEFLKQHADSVRPNTLRGYHTVWNEHIEPRLGTKKLVSVRTGDIDRLLRSVAQANPEMRHGTLARIKAFIHLVFEEAIRQEVFDGRNPAASATAVAKNKTSRPTGCYTDEEAQAVIAAVP